MKTGVLGGTFNPVHLGHLHLAQAALQILDLDQVLFIPSCSPPHKKDSNLCAFHHRLAMLEQAVAPFPECIVSDIESRRVGLSYTIDTLRQLDAERRTGEEFIFLMGFDAFQEMATWKEYLRIPEYAAIAVCERNGNAVSETAGDLFGPASALITPIDVPEEKVSSSVIRKYLAGDRKAARKFLPHSVFAYIEEHNLFV
jgi:nicotinate-nucleotide adenylyltransferase